MKSLRVEEIQSGLGTKRIGKRVHYFPALDSTNIYAHKRAQEGGEEGEVIIAESQTQGKGRMGRQWVSPPCLNLYLSVILRPRLAPSDAPQLTLMSAVAVAETVKAFLPFPPEIKWPNDILAGGKKLAGILTESACERDRILFVILGIGVNLNFPLELMPEVIRGSATSLLILTGAPVDRTDFARRLIQGIDQCYGDLEENGFSRISRRWDSFFGIRGKRVRVEMQGEIVLGKAIGIDGQGALILEEDGGALKKIIAGDVTPVEP